ncbi:MAG: DUF853 family protein [Saprospiraceae bacterium]|nr:DUF853 family protein [Saprospiraceae bacterium]
MKEKFVEDIQKSYLFKGDSFFLGCGFYDNMVVSEARVSLPIKMFNRHGLIAGATGTGKTKTLQVLAEQLSQKGVSSLLLDIKGDLSGIAAEGASNPKIIERHQLLNEEWKSFASPVEFLTLSDQPGTRLRATVSEFGPVLLSKILNLNDTQQGVVALIFKFCDDRALPLLDLRDLKKVLQYVSNEGKNEIIQEFGSVSSTSVGTILRKIIELEQQGAESFFGERSFEVEDLVRTNREGHGMVSILRVVDIQDKPKFFSTFMLQILAEIYSKFPEEGDPDKPKLVMFLDEAHLLFEEASEALLNQMETIIKLIRSKGIGLIFITQNPIDIPASILSQLGMKIQHALRAFTAKDRKAIKMAAENYPETNFYNVSKIITELGIGEALVTALNEKGIPTALVHTMLRAPESRMDVLKEDEILSIVRKSEIAGYYNEQINRESAEEILSKKLEDFNRNFPEKETQNSRTGKHEKSTVEKVLGSPTARSLGNTVVREVTRGLMGMLGIKTRSTTRKSTTGWF